MGRPSHQQTEQKRDEDVRDSCVRNDGCQTVVQTVVQTAVQTVVQDNNDAEVFT